MRQGVVSCFQCILGNAGGAAEGQVPAATWMCAKTPVCLLVVAETAICMECSTPAPLLPKLHHDHGSMCLEKLHLGVKL